MQSRAFQVWGRDTVWQCESQSLLNDHSSLIALSYRGIRAETIADIMAVSNIFLFYLYREAEFVAEEAVDVDGAVGASGTQLNVLSF